jgi:aryl-alcohol dehydrogenase-like predicted oxidoreductase
MNFGAFGGRGNPDHDDCAAIIGAALDAGINIIDTADGYSVGESEEIVGKAVRGRRDEVLLATKGHVRMGRGVNMRGNSRLWLTRAVEDSLRRLGTDHIDLYQVHRPDPATDIDDTLGVLTDLVRAGKVRYLGSSVFLPSAVVEAQWAAQRRGTERFVCEQPPYSLLTRGIEQDLLPTCQRHGMGTIPYSPLAGGWLSGRIGADGVAPGGTRGLATEDAANARKLEAVLGLTALADQAGLPLPVLAVAWAMNHPGVTSPIVGPRTMEQLTSLLPALEVRLDDDLLDAIDAIVPPGTNQRDDDAGTHWLYGQPGAAIDPRAHRR